MKIVAPQATKKEFFRSIIQVQDDRDTNNMNGGTDMKKGLTELVFILDESGSMHPLTNDTIGGFNSLIEKQKKEEGEAFVSTVMFADNSKVVHDRVDIKEIPELTKNDYVPGGCTALNDAIGDAIRHIGNIHKYAREEDVPEHTIFFITTDGMENASRRYSGADVKKLIERQKEKYGWEFAFLASNIDAKGTARDFGIDEDMAVEISPDAEGTMLNYCMMSACISEKRAPRTRIKKQRSLEQIKADLEAE